MKAIVIGAGRMGMRHIRGLDGIAETIDVVEPRADAEGEIIAAAPQSTVRVHLNLGDALRDKSFDAGILSATAAGRLEDFEALQVAGVANILVEKPIEQGRARTRAVLDRAQNGAGKVWFNHYRRALQAFHPLLGRGPFVITVTSGAMGLGCNGIHWIDFSVFLSGAKGGKLLWGEIEDEKIGSGRGAAFRDYGGRGVFAFDDGSRLFLSCRAESAAPTSLSIVSKDTHWIVDQHNDETFMHQRAEGPAHPAYLYGKDFGDERARGLEAVDLIANTSLWAQAIRDGKKPPQPRASDVALAYELLFDLLETSGDNSFDFT